MDTQPIQVTMNDQNSPSAYTATCQIDMLEADVLFPFNDACPDTSLIGTFQGIADSLAFIELSPDNAGKAALIGLKFYEGLGAPTLTIPVDVFENLGGKNLPAGSQVSLNFISQRENDVTSGSMQDGEVIGAHRVMCVTSTLQSVMLAS